MRVGDAGEVVVLTCLRPPGSGARAEETCYSYCAKYADLGKTTKVIGGPERRGDAASVAGAAVPIWGTFGARTPRARLHPAPALGAGGGSREEERGRGARGKNTPLTYFSSNPTSRRRWSQLCSRCKRARSALRCLPPSVPPSKSRILKRHRDMSS